MRKIDYEHTMASIKAPKLDSALGIIMAISSQCFERTRGKKKFRIVVDYDADESNMVDIKFYDLTQPCLNKDHQET